MKRSTRPVIRNVTDIMRSILRMSEVYIMKTGRSCELILLSFESRG